jgi:hypothetical protein
MPKRPWRAVAASAGLCLLVAAGPRAQPAPPAPLAGWFIADASAGGVVVLLGDGGDLYVPIADFNRTQSGTDRPGHPAAIIDMPPALTSRVVGTRVHIGDPWTIDSTDAGRFQATVDHFVLGYKNCGEAWGIFLRVIAPQPDRLVSISGGAFIAHAGAIVAPGSRTVGEIDRQLSEPERGEMVMLLEQARRQTIGGVRHQWAQEDALRTANPALRDWNDRWTELDKSLDRQDARLTFDQRLYRVTSDADPRVFVQARWTVHGFVAYALTMWARLSGSHLTIESVDAAPATLIRTPEMQSVTIDRTTSHVLGVFDVNGDGRAEVLMLRPGYESIDRDLIEYPATAGQPPRVLSHYGDGC